MYQMCYLSCGHVSSTWLIINPFVRRLPGDGGWVYHDVVREQMLRYRRIESPAEWAAQHERLAAR